MAKSELVVKTDSGIDTLIAQAIDKSVPVETMEKLLAMRTQLKQEVAKEQYNKDLSDFQCECPVIGKNKDVMVDGKKRYSYAPLDEIVQQTKELLHKHGFSYTFNSEFLDNAQIITCTARHIGGWSETAKFRSPIDVKAFMTEVQKQGSAMTFAKRYSFCQVFGIMTGDEDDDGQTEATPPVKTKPIETPKEEIIPEENKLITTLDQLDAQVKDTKFDVMGEVVAIVEGKTKTDKPKTVYTVKLTGDLTADINRNGTPSHNAPLNEIVIFCNVGKFGNGYWASEIKKWDEQ